ncbi:hypothetical protein SERLA73DRAFT_169707 [Serpula lacrymans var. lacrymans S7.3]|uniref:Uncharacterized protein n=2 Tax=Serpula lacrymans var. lacrymans TaxID=341189 RepID=F8Q2D7_SERL3|nr:uncharacterized protein SERLADRAFT_450642 [Serpula lacrymans var. lacrymans S7.9]EGN97348.1 hypothetical protein SERLA73DRAFT_169707 [Serpula lacrymans var. lacrymans S7.3]EGO22940.1 hypothetical protein SERLADRAFT_450642 [Serpula lacrymans var. lacrymans S7.9]
MSLAVDTSTHLTGRSSPEGILYTGGRDGLVMSWDLGLPMKRRPPRHINGAQHKPANRWETLTGMADDFIDEEIEDEERMRSDGDILGDVKESSGRRRRHRQSEDIPYESQWEMDSLADRPTVRPAQFRQCAQTHTDWVNDIILCNYNQTVVSASSDGAVKAWNPHTTTTSIPSTIGLHADYARCLTLCREQNWIASGSFDRTIKLWDLSRTTSPSGVPDPLMTLNPPDATAPKSSVYAIATDPFGHAIASGSPERVVRLWDPRSGKRTGKLVGHTDNIRAILISEDARYLLTGSADASVKLWSLASQRCLHTFTYHVDSVWSLFSTHPTLEVFYSGDKSGLVCKVDVEDCVDVSEGACTVICQESTETGTGEGVNKIVSVDDQLLWTASGSSSVKRWKVPQTRYRRSTMHGTEFEDLLADSISPRARRRVSAGIEVPLSPVRLSSPPMSHGLRDREDDDSVPLECRVRLISPNDPFSPTAFHPRGRDADVATLYSAASIVSVPGGKSPFVSTFQSNAATLRGDNLSSETGLPRTDLDERELAADAVPFNRIPDDIIAGDHGLVRSIILNDRIHALTVDTSGEVAVWDIVRGICLGRFPREDVAAASRCGSVSGTSSGGERERSPREALEAVRERIEGEAVVSPWSNVDTKTGVLTIHISERCFEAEIYADEAGFGSERHFSDELRFNIGKWVLRNLFLGFIREEQRARKKRDGHESPYATIHRGSTPIHIDLNGNSPLNRPGSASSKRSARLAAPASSIVVSSSEMIPAVTPTAPLLTSPSPLLTPRIPLHSLKASLPLSSIPQSPTPLSNELTPMPGPIRTTNLDSSSTGPPTSGSTPRETDYFSSRARRPSTSSAGDDFSGWGGPGTFSRAGGGDSSGLQSPSTPSGLMGRLKSFGKNNHRRANTESGPGSPTIGASADSLETPTIPEETSDQAQKTPVQILLAGPLSPPSSSELPTLSLPPDISIIISDEAYPGWRTVYRGNVSSTSADVYTLEETIPMWLLEYLLLNKVSSTPPVKVSFVLLPWPKHDPDGEQLPELLNTAQSKLTASRFLRVRKLTHHVQDKLEKLAHPSASPAASTPPSPFAPRSPDSPSPSPKSSRPKAEDTYEILCNNSVLPLDMTLAAVRQYFWRQSAELVMHYRLK